MKINYPFEFNEVLLTQTLLDKMGFSEYWRDSGDSGTRTLDLGGKIGDTFLLQHNQYPSYHIHVIDEKDDDCDGYCDRKNYSPQRIVSKDFMKSLYFLHDIYEDISENRTPKEIKKFLDIVEKNNMSHQLNNYIKWKTNLIT